MVGAILTGMLILFGDQSIRIFAKSVTASETCSDPYKSENLWEIIADEMQQRQRFEAKFLLQCSIRKPAAHVMLGRDAIITTTIILELHPYGNNSIPFEDVIDPKLVYQIASHT